MKKLLFFILNIVAAVVLCTAAFNVCCASKIGTVVSPKFPAASMTLGVGDRGTRIAAAITSDASKKITYSSSAPSVATVNSRGDVTAKKSGTAIISAKAYNGKSAKYTLYVKAAPKSVKLSCSAATLGKGESLKLTYSVNSGAYGSHPTYKSSNSKVVTVTTTGLIKAVGTGTATVTLRLYNGVSAKCKITVKKAPTTISLSFKNITLEHNGSATLYASLNSGSTMNSRCKFSTSNAAVATVNQNGLVKATKNDGTVKITATAYNGVKAVCTVTVETVKMPSGTYRLISPSQTPWYLIVVNRYKRVPSDYTPILSPLLKAEGYDARLDSRVVPYYEKMYYAARADGIILRPYSAYRSYERQKINFENRINLWRSRGYSYNDAVEKTAEVILPAGGSEHNLGLAVDINGTNYSFNQTAAYAWLSKNAYKYGFIQRYVEGTHDITGVVCEPWHWRFVGVTAATQMHGSKICLEQYLKSKGITY